MHVSWDPTQPRRAAEDFMLKEIHEQPEAVRNTMRGRTDADGRIVLDDIHLTTDELSASTRW